MSEAVVTYVANGDPTVCPDWISNKEKKLTIS